MPFTSSIFSVDMIDSDSDQARELKELIWNVMKDAGKQNLADYFPVFKKLDPQDIRQRVVVNFSKMLDLSVEKSVWA